MFKSSANRRRGGSVRVFGSLVLAWALVALGSQGMAQKAQLGNYDIRVDGSPAALMRGAVATQSLAPRRTAVLGEVEKGQAGLRAQIADLEIAADPILGVPKIIRSASAKLTGKKLGRAANEIVQEFVTSHNGAFGLTAAAVGTQLKTAADYENPSNGARWVTLRQEINGIPVFRGELRAALTPDGEIVGIANDLAPGLDETALLGPPALSAEEAVVIAASLCAYNVGQSELVRKDSDPEGSQIAFYPAGDLGIIYASQVVFPLAPGDAVPAWQVSIGGNGRGYTTVIDANQGQMLLRVDAVNEQTRTATYEYYDADSPAPGTPWPFPVTPGINNPIPGAYIQAPAVPRVQKTLINEHPSNLEGWLADGEIYLRGNNVVVGRDQMYPDGIDADPNSPGRTSTAYGTNIGPSPTGRNYVFPGWEPAPDGFDGPQPNDGLTGLPPLNEPYDSGVVTNLFFWINRFHDRMYAYGFTESSGNFQTKNFNRGGVQGDAVSAESNDYGASNNAYFSTYPDGIPGTAQMGRFNGMGANRDSSLDQQVIVHELTHGMTNRLIGNSYGLRYQQGRGLGEGWSDFIGVSLMTDYPESRTEADRDPDLVYPTGGYLTVNLGGVKYDNYFYGDRRFPFCTSLKTNPLTWADADPDQYNSTVPRGPLAGTEFTPESPLCFSLSGGEVHNLGEIWTSMLWAARAHLMKVYKGSGDPEGYKTGNGKMIQTVVDGIKLTPTDPTFIEARNSLLDAAVIQAGTLSAPSVDPANTQLAAHAELAVWKGCAERGLGYSATGPGSLDRKVTPREKVNFYSVSHRVFNTPKPSATSIPLELDEEGSAMVDLAGDTVSYYGKTYPSVWVSGNGYVTFEGPDTIAQHDAVTRCAMHYAVPRISAYFTDWVATSATISYNIDSNFLTITWQNLLAPGTDVESISLDEAPKNTFQIRIGLDSGRNVGQIDLNYFGDESITHLAGIVGLSQPPTDPDTIDACPQIDFSTLQYCNPNLPKPTFFTEEFEGTGGDENFDLHKAQFQFTVVSAEGWKVPPVEAYDFPLTSAQPLIIDDAGGNGNGAIEPGETVVIQIPVVNKFKTVNLSNVFARVSLVSGDVSVVGSEVAYGSIDAGRASYGVVPQGFTVEVPDDAPCGAEFELEVRVISQQTNVAVNPPFDDQFDYPAMIGRMKFTLADAVGPTTTYGPYPQQKPSAVLGDNYGPTSRLLQLSSASNFRAGIYVQVAGTSETMRVESYNHISKIIGVTRGAKATKPTVLTAGSALEYVSTVVPEAVGTGVTTFVDVPDDFLVGDVTVNLRNIPHQRVGDLIIKLGHPDGNTTITLMNRLGNGSGMNRSKNIQNLTLNDLAPLEVQAQTGAVSDLVCRPAESLSGFSGMKSKGRWMLQVSDVAAPYLGEVGEWSIGLAPKLTPCPAASLMATPASITLQGWTPYGYGDLNAQAVFPAPSGPAAIVMHVDPSDDYRIPVVISPAAELTPWPNQIYRFGAHVYRSGQVDPNELLEIPNLRLQCQVEFAQIASKEYIFNSKAIDPTAGVGIRPLLPSTDPTQPTWYHVDLDPVDVPALNTPGAKVTGMIQHIGVDPTQHGDLNIVEASITRYTAPTNDQGTLVRVYSGADFANGYTQSGNMANPGIYNDTPYARPFSDADETGVALDSQPVQLSAFSFVSYDLNPQGEDPVVKPGKMYRVRYHLSSNTNARSNPGFQLRARTINWCNTNYFEVGQALSGLPISDKITVETLPGIGTLNPYRDPWELQGGWYTLYLDAPPVVTSTNGLDKLRFGWDLFDGLWGVDEPWASSVSGRIRLDRIEVTEFDQFR